MTMDSGAMTTSSNSCENIAMNNLVDARIPALATTLDMKGRFEFELQESLILQLRAFCSVRGIEKDVFALAALCAAQYCRTACPQVIVGVLCAFADDHDSMRNQVKVSPAMHILRVATEADCTFGDLLQQVAERLSKSSIQDDPELEDAEIVSCWRKTPATCGVNPVPASVGPSRKSAENISGINIELNI
ncbi:hypothetical protein EJ03DRAFT_17358 [Teratosphaeria nubilosa]|uniref:Uncharacterized protein n=1 Tax=Teratosphaeria nubilosa TaxID=161662 RepID=A0A6G1KVP4_9PEZI|nr:hypothetical protein EJ03DRAFT_17358 [Teratosphaeria nubilosa]